MERASLYWNTIKHLTQRQIFYRIYYRFRKNKNIHLDDHDDVSFKTYDWTFIPFGRKSLSDGNNVCLLNVTRHISSPSSWNDENDSHLWKYNLHYFNDWGVFSDDDRRQQKIDLMTRWINENPISEGVGWEPYPMSLRIVNWMKFLFDSQDVDLTKVIKSLRWQAEMLSTSIEHHLSGNHVLANAKALIFAGVCIESPESNGWLREGLDLYMSEIRLQFLADGGHYELSPMYHNILLWDLFDLIQLSYVSRDPLLDGCVEEWRRLAALALSWASNMCHPDGDIAFFNDAAFAMAPRQVDLERYADFLKMERHNFNSSPLVTLIESGYSRVEQNAHTLLIDHANVGPSHQPGHAHADTLSFEWSVGAERIFVNSGTSIYGNSQERQLQRKTSAHNTVEIDGEDSSQVWGGFRVAKRAVPQILEKCIEKESHVVLKISHDGYERRDNNRKHVRSIYSTPDELVIKDKVSGRYDMAIARFFVHPDVSVAPLDRCSFELLTKTGTRIILESTQEIESKSSRWHYQFGKSAANIVLEITLLTGITSEINLLVDKNWEKSNEK